MNRRKPTNLYITFYLGMEVDVWKMAQIASSNKKYRTKSAIIWAVWNTGRGTHGHGLRLKV